MAQAGAFAQAGGPQLAFGARQKSAIFARHRDQPLRMERLQLLLEADCPFIATLRGTTNDLSIPEADVRPLVEMASWLLRRQAAVTGPNTTLLRQLSI